MEVNFGLIHIFDYIFFFFFLPIAMLTSSSGLAILDGGSVFCTHEGSFPTSGIRTVVVQIMIVVVLIKVEEDAQDRLIKIEINRYDGKSNFSIWQARVKNVLI